MRAALTFLLAVGVGSLALAGHIGAARVAHPEALIPVLTGNLHARTSASPPAATLGGRP
jgi:hypothetical protein